MLFNRTKRPVAGTVLVAFLALVLQPLSVLAQDRPASAASRRAAESGEEKFSRTLNEIHEILKEVAPQAAMPHMFPRKKGETELRAIGPNMKIEVEPPKPRPGTDVAAKVAQLRAKAEELASLEQYVRSGFDETARHIKEKDLPAEVLARHEEALKAYEARAAEFKALVGAVDRSAAAGGAPLQTALNDLAAFMAKYPNQKTHTPSDPNNLPWGSPKPVTREPYTSPSQFRTSRLFGEPVRVAQAGSLSGINLPSTTLPATPTPADLAPTEDVQITQPIRDLAASLNNHPVQIYNWVRNNIEFVPSYGSIQGSDMTLQTKRGNSFDTASLLIALFRAANIPARYVYGTIEVPADKAMNWVGGVTVPHAAMNLISQGGIPVMGIAQSGVVRSIRLEHVWVEAFVDYVPSRGAVNRQPDTWVPMDASFKQREFTQGMDLQNTVPFDGSSFLTQIRNAATINETEGWVQNINQLLAQQTLVGYQTRVTNYVNSQKASATIGDVLGAQSIVQEHTPILLGTLPYRTIATGAKLQAIPDNLRWKFRYDLFANDMDRAFDSPFVSYVRNTPSLAGKKITLSFIPATPTDLAVINSRLPAPHADGTPIQVAELPKSLPAYLIRMIPELRVDGEVVASGSAVTMGSELVQVGAVFDPTRGWVSSEANRPIVGEYIATTLSLQGFSESALAALRSKLSNTAAKLATSPAQRVSKEEFTGDSLHAALVTYFADADFRASVLGRMFGAVHFFQPSFGNFLVTARPVFSFGIVRAVSFPGLVVDIDRMSVQAVAKDANSRVSVAFLQSMGQALSEGEAAIPEKLFNSVRRDGHGVSTTRAVAAALQQGQRIYSLDATTAPTNLPILAIDPAVKEEIGNAVAAGRFAITSQSNIAVGGWSGIGYAIIDPETGAGAYKISGGFNGGGLDYVFANLMALAAMSLDALLSLGVGPAYAQDVGTTSSQAQPQNNNTLFDCILTIIICVAILVAIAYLIVYIGVPLLVNPIIDFAVLLSLVAILYFLSQLISAACANTFPSASRLNGVRPVNA